MTSRRKSRKIALQILFALDMQNDFSKSALKHLQENFTSDEEINLFSIQIVEGIIDNKEEIDSLIEKHSNNWKLYRMSFVDRNIMRIAIFEILFKPDIPLSVSINEAVDIAKKFGGEKSPSFINGIIDKIKDPNEKKD